MNACLKVDTHQLDLQQGDVDEDGELLYCSQSFEQSNHPGVNVLSQGPGEPVYHSGSHKIDRRDTRVRT